MLSSSFPLKYFYGCCNIFPYAGDESSFLFYDHPFAMDLMKLLTMDSGLPKQESRKAIAKY